MPEFGRIAKQSGDPLLGELLLALNQDCRWHREWSTSLSQLLREDDIENGKIIGSWVAEWHTHIERALVALGPFVGEANPLPGLTRGEPSR